MAQLVPKSRSFTFNDGDWNRLRTILGRMGSVDFPQLETDVNDIMIPYTGADKNADLGANNLSLQGILTVGTYAQTANDIQFKSKSPSLGKDSEFFYNAGKAALVVGSIGTSPPGHVDSEMGEESIALGSEARATSFRSTAIGNQCLASAQDSFALGRQCTASGTNSFALGNNAVASATDSFGFGISCKPQTTKAFAIGWNQSNLVPNSIQIGISATANETVGELEIVEGAVTITGTLAVTDDIIMSDGKFIRTGTSDGTDDESIGIAGGGSLSSIRGSFVKVSGNEDASSGTLFLTAGNVSGGEIILSTGGLQRAVIDNAGNFDIGTNDIKTSGKVGGDGVDFAGGTFDLNGHFWHIDGVTASQNIARLGMDAANISIISMGCSAANSARMHIATIFFGLIDTYLIRVFDTTAATQRDLVSWNTETGKTTIPGECKIEKGITLPTVSKTANYTTTTSDHTITCGAGNETFTITLITAVGNTGLICHIKNVGTGTITVDGDGSETIDGATTQVISTQYDSIMMQSDGTEWWII